MTDGWNIVLSDHVSMLAVTMLNTVSWMVFISFCNPATLTLTLREASVYVLLSVMEQ